LVLTFEVLQFGPKFALSKSLSKEKIPQFGPCYFHGRAQKGRPLQSFRNFLFFVSAPNGQPLLCQKNAHFFIHRQKRGVQCEKNVDTLPENCKHWTTAKNWFLHNMKSAKSNVAIASVTASYSALPSKKRKKKGEKKENIC
jgi:hypothetical protein